MRPRPPLRALLALILMVLSAAAARAAGSELIIGLSQFPTILHPSIESMIVKAYALWLVQRPLTAYDADW